MQIPRVVITPIALALAGMKRNVLVLMEVDLGKGPAALLEAVSADLGLVLELSLPNFAGSIIVSPLEKHKIGHPVGSKV